MQVAEAEAFEEFRREKEKVRLSLVILPPAAPGAGATVPLQEARRAFDADPAKYTRPERARFAYAAVLAKDLQPAAPASDAELLSYYEQNPAEFRTERAVHARHILFRLAEGAAPEEEKKIRERAQFVLGKAKAGTDFAALAREFSQDSSGPAGGDLGWFSAGQMVPAFEQAAFALGKGQVSDLVRTQFGFHIIKVEETREAGTPTFEQARAEVARKRAAAAARAAVAARVEQINDALANGEFDAVAAKFGMTVRKTELVPREDPLPGPAARSEVVESCSASLKANQRNFPSGRRLLGLPADAKRAAAVPSFEEASAEVEQELLARKAGSAPLASPVAARGAAPGREAAKHRRQGEGRGAGNGVFRAARFRLGSGIKGEILQGAFPLWVGSFGGPVVAPGDGSSSTASTGNRRFRARHSSRKRCGRRPAAQPETGPFFESWMKTCDGPAP